MSTASNAKGNSFDFTCNCGFSRRVTDAEINFTCERPKTDPGHTGCPYHYKMTKDGTAAGIPSIKRVSAAGVDQSDNTVVSSTLGSGGSGTSLGSQHFGIAINQQHTTAHK